MLVTCEYLSTRQSRGTDGSNVQFSAGDIELFTYNGTRFFFIFCRPAGVSINFNRGETRAH